MADAGRLRRRLRIFRRRRQKRAAETAMSVVEHLGELRTRLMVSALAFVGISVAVFIIYEPILEIFRRPLCSVPRENLGPQGCDLIYTTLIGGFQFRLKLTAMVGIALSSPVWLYQVWAFVVPALTLKEKRYATPFIGTSIFLFLAGGTLAYLVLPTGLRLLIRIGGENLVLFPSAEEYLNFIGLMLLGFGLMFELPLVLFFLGLIGVVSTEQLKRQRRVAIVTIAALAALVTPSQDPYTMLVMAIPLYLMYEVTIFVLGSVIKRRKARADVDGT
jgi:sec-independent protein translocase protein TatC